MKRTVTGRLKRADESSEFVAVQMAAHPGNDLVRGGFVSFGSFVLGKQNGEIRGGSQTRYDRCARERMDAVSIFPQIPTRFRESGLGIAIRFAFAA